VTALPAAVLLALVAAAGTATAADLTMRDYEFVPLEVRASAGRDVTVENAGAALHTVTDKQSRFHVQVSPGLTGTFLAPIDPGTYAFVCAYHPEMTGTLVVGEAKPEIAVRTPAPGGALVLAAGAVAALGFTARR